MIRTILTVATVATMLAMAGPIGRAYSEAQPQQSSAQTTGTALNLNTATQADLEKLPGVGPAMAKQILDYRQKNNGFKKVEELMNIKGIGEKSFLKLKPLVTVAPAKTQER
jgi:competence protein ComEA